MCVFGTLFEMTHLRMSSNQGGHTKTGNPMLEEGAGTKLQPKETTDQEKGKTKGGKEKSCPLLKNAPEGCYCYNLDSHANIEKAIYYCLMNFRDCEIYTSIQIEKGHQNLSPS